MSSQNPSKKPRKQQKSKPEIDLDALVQAIKDVKLNQRPIRSTAKNFSIPRTNLMRYIERLNDEVPDITAIPDSNLKDILLTYTARVPPLMVFQNYLFDLFLSFNYLLLFMFQVFVR